MNVIISNSPPLTNAFTNFDGTVVHTTMDTTIITLPPWLWFTALALLGCFLWWLLRPRGESR